MLDKKVGVVFSGFGSQFVGMGKEAYDDSRTVQEYFEEAYNCLGINFVKLCFASSDEELSKITNAYLAIFLTDISLYALLLELGVTPSVLAGYGIGRYAAIFAGSGFSLPDGLYLLNKYANFYQEFLDHKHHLKLLAIDNFSVNKLKKICKDLATAEHELYLTAIGSETSATVVGQAKLVDKLMLKLKELNLEIALKELNLGWGINSELANSIVTNFKVYFSKVDLKALKIPILSTLSGKAISTALALKKELIDQELKPIMWQKVVAGLVDCDVIIEVGPGHELANQLQTVYPHKMILMLNKKADLVKIKALLLPEHLEENYEE